MDPGEGRWTPKFGSVIGGRARPLPPRLLAKFPSSIVWRQSPNTFHPLSAQTTSTEGSFYGFSAFAVYGEPFVIPAAGHIAFAAEPTR